METDFYKKCFVVLTNEIKPRAAKCGVTINELLEPSVAHYLVQLEYQGYITRRELRTILDERVKFLNDSLHKDTLEELSQHG